jgi:hypothetical protein
MDSVDQKTAMYVAAGVAAGAFIGYHLQGSNSCAWCPWMWGTYDARENAHSGAAAASAQSPPPATLSHDDLEAP